VTGVQTCALPISHILRLDIHDRVLAIEMGNNEIDGGWQKQGFWADVLWILEADHRLARQLNRENRYGS